ncbi:MAG: DNA-binding protein, partial [Arcobacteraceae bacterium]
DLFVPKSMQKIPFKVGMKTVLRVCIDEQTDRIVGNHKYTKYLSKSTKGLEKNQQVKFIVYKKTDLGYKVIVNDLYDALLFHSDVFENINVGDIKIGYIKSVREDGKIDITLKPVGQASVDNDTKKVLDILAQNGGKMNFTYKSSPEDIKETFGLSRKAYKKALTSLIESNKISLDEEYIKLV